MTSMMHTMIHFQVMGIRQQGKFYGFFTHRVQCILH